MCSTGVTSEARASSGAMLLPARTRFRWKQPAAAAQLGQVGSIYVRQNCRYTWDCCCTLTCLFLNPALPQFVFTLPVSLRSIFQLSPYFRNYVCCFYCGCSNSVLHTLIHLPPSLAGTWALSPLIPCLISVLLVLVAFALSVRCFYSCSLPSGSLWDSLC